MVSMSRMVTKRIRRSVAQMPRCSRDGRSLTAFRCIAPQSVRVRGAQHGDDDSLAKAMRDKVQACVQSAVRIDYRGITYFLVIEGDAPALPRQNVESRIVAVDGLFDPTGRRFMGIPVAAV